MKNKIIMALVCILFLSGCSTIMGDQTKKSISTTKNGSILFTTKDTIQAFCEKSTLDSLVKNYDETAIKTEFNIVEYDKYLYSNNKKNYMPITMSPKCNYNILHYDYITDYNEVEIGQLEVKKDQIIKTTELKNNELIKTFIKKDQLTANSQLVKYILESDSKDLILAEDIDVKKDGKMTLIAKPVFRNYHFEDKKKIIDYDFSVIVGIKFELK